jgi:hypothetical protein
MLERSMQGKPAEADWFEMTDAEHASLCERYAGRRVRFPQPADGRRDGVGVLTVYAKRLSRERLQAYVAIINAEGSTVKWTLHLPRETVGKLEHLSGREIEFMLDLPPDFEGMPHHHATPENQKMLSRYTALNQHPAGTRLARR